MEELTIGEVARQTGLRTSALRYYESIGLVSATRGINGHRRYDPNTVQIVGVIQLAQQAGFTIAEIQTLLYGFAPATPPRERWQPLVERKLEELDALIAHAQQMQRILTTLLECGCMRLEECGMGDRGAGPPYTECGEDGVSERPSPSSRRGC